MSGPNVVPVTVTELDDSGVVKAATTTEVQAGGVVSAASVTELLTTGVITPPSSSGMVYGTSGAEGSLTGTQYGYTYQRNTQHARATYWYDSAQTMDYGQVSAIVPASDDLYWQVKSENTAAYATMLATFPATRTGKVYMHFWNEPEDNIADGSLTMARWQAACDALFTAIGDSGKNYIIPTVELQLMTLKNTNTGTHGTLDSRWLPNYLRPGLRHVGWSAYAREKYDANNHLVPTNPALATADTLYAWAQANPQYTYGVITGFGTLSVPPSTDLADSVSMNTRLGWTLDFGRALNTRGCKHFLWFDTFYTSKDYRIRTEPLLQSAWDTLTQDAGQWGTTTGGGTGGGGTGGGGTGGGGTPPPPPPPPAGTRPYPMVVSPDGGAAAQRNTKLAVGFNGWVEYGGGAATWNSDMSGVAAVHKNDPINLQVSFKQYTEAGLVSILDNIPEAWLPGFRMGYFQEPEDNLTTTAGKTGYKNTYSAMAAVMRAHPRSAKYGLLPWPELQEWYVNPANGNRSISKPEDFLPPLNDIGGVLWSFFEFKMKDRIVAQTDRIVAWMKQFAPGKPWALMAGGARLDVGQFGPITAADRTYQANWMQHQFDYTRSKGCKGWAWYDIGPTPFEYRIEANPQAQAKLDAINKAGYTTDV